jgi:hypothetical protein
MLAGANVYLDRRPERKVSYQGLYPARQARRHIGRLGEAARKLQEMGLVSYDRGRFRIVNRAAMEQMACECYEVVRGEFEGLYKNSPDERT